MGLQQKHGHVMSEQDRTYTKIEQVLCDFRWANVIGEFKVHMDMTPIKVVAQADAQKVIDSPTYALALRMLGLVLERVMGDTEYDVKWDNIIIKERQDYRNLGTQILKWQEIQNDEVFIALYSIFQLQVESHEVIKVVGVNIDSTTVKFSFGYNIPDMSPVNKTHILDNIKNVIAAYSQLATKYKIRYFVTDVNKTGNIDRMNIISFIEAAKSITEMIDNWRKEK